jgi:predicted dehydrogenase
LGDFEDAFGTIATYYWGMEVEDNAFALFKTAKGQTASMHTSWTQWKNRFIFEIFGEAGYLIVEGLGRSYGTETLHIGRRKKVNSYKLLGDKGQRLVDLYKLSVDTKNEKKNSFNKPITNQLITNNDVRNYHNKPITNQLITNQLITNNIVLQYAGGAPEEEAILFDGPDISWEEEWKEFTAAIREKHEPLGNGQDGLEANRMIEAVYHSARENRPIKIKEVR